MDARCAAGEKCGEVVRCKEEGSKPKPRAGRLRAGKLVDRGAERRPRDDPKATATLRGKASSNPSIGVGLARELIWPDSASLVLAWPHECHASGSPEQDAGDVCSLRKLPGPAALGGGMGGVAPRGP